MLLVTTVYENSCASGGLAGLDIPPSVSDHVASAQVDIVLVRCIDNHAWMRFPAGAPIRIVMEADTELMDGQEGAELQMNGIDNLAPLPASRHIGLVCHNDEAKSGLAESAQGFAHSGQYLNIIDAHGRVRSAISKNGSIKDAITVQEHGPETHFIPSHLVCADLRVG